MLKVYCENLVDVVFSDSHLGFRIGETDLGNTAISSFSDKPDEAASIVKEGYLILRINDEDVSQFEFAFVREMLRSRRRPMTIRFAKPRESSGSLLKEIGFIPDNGWDDSDSFLPIRKYDFTNYPICNTYKSRAAFTLRERALEPMCENGLLFDCDIREFAYNGLIDKHTRAIIWKILLRVLTTDPAKWEEKSLHNLSTYEEYVQEFIISQNDAVQHKGCRNVPSPIDVTWKKEETYKVDDEDPLSNESKWSRDFGDSSMREIIWKDVERTYSNMDFFSNYNKQVMARLLFVFGKLNSGIRYVQGMNELLAPLLYVFAENHINETVSSQIEADTFFAFHTLMSETRDLFLHEMDTASSGLGGLLTKLDSYIYYHIPSLANHFMKLNITSQFFAISWLTTLFARTFTFETTLRLWDLFLADPNRFMCVQCFATALVHLKEHNLMSADFSTAISILQNYDLPDIPSLLQQMNSIRINELRRLSGYYRIGDISTSMCLNRSIMNIEIVYDISDKMKAGWSFLTKLKQKAPEPVNTSNNTSSNRNSESN